MEEKRLMETVMATETLYEGKIVRLEKWRVQLQNGRVATREVVKHVGGAAVVAVDARGRVAMVRQYRCVMGREMLEIPAGKLNYKGEDRLEAAQRELREETGLTAGTWTHLCDSVSTPGFCDEVIGLYLATDLTQGEMQPDEDEFLRFELIDYQALIRRIERGELQDGKSVSALLLARAPLIKLGLIDRA